MYSLARELRTKPAPSLMALSAAGFAILAMSPPDAPGFSLCGSLSSVTRADLHLLVPDGRTLSILTVAWLVMVAAMMPLLIVQQVRHAMQSSVARRSNISALLFLAGYGLIWMVAGLAMIPMAAVIHAFGSPSIAIIAVAIAFVWTASPVGGWAHNACHRLYSVAASGPTANQDCLVHGVRTGMACTAACWPWMIMPFGFPVALHLSAMATATVILFFERIGPTRKPAWRMPYVFRLVFRGRPHRSLGRP